MKPAPLPAAERGHGWMSDLYGKTVDGVIVDREVHVFPLDDVMPHSVPASECWCGPRIDFDHGTPICVHASADGRELDEHAQEAK